MPQPDLSQIDQHLALLAREADMIALKNAATGQKLAELERLHQQAFDLIGPNRSLGPIFLQAMHRGSVQVIQQDAAGVSNFVTELAGRLTDLPSVCFLVEVLISGQTYDQATQTMEQVLAQTQGDFRSQDLMYRLRHYRDKEQYDANRQGLELSHLHCNTPFQKADFLVGGNIHQCCSVWLKQPAGNMFEEDAADVWQGKNAETIRQSVRDGSFTYCGRMACHHFNNDMLPPANANGLLTEATATPTHLNLSYDLTCNLFCPSCRTEKIAARGDEADRIQSITETSVLPLLKDAKYVEICGSGDPFASKSFRHVLRELNPEDNPHLKITLMTNGQLFNAREWERFEHLQGMIEQVNVSVDAAEPLTYSILRRGGEFEKLIPNLKFIGELLDEEKIGGFRMCFVVQGSNYDQMPDFVRLSEEVGANAIHFQMLHDWGTMDRTSLTNSLIQMTNHPKHDDFVGILRDVSTMDRNIKIYSDFDEILPIEK